MTIFSQIRFNQHDFIEIQAIWEKIVTNLGKIVTGKNLFNEKIVIGKKLFKGTKGIREKMSDNPNKLMADFSF